MTKIYFIKKNNSRGAISLLVVLSVLAVISMIAIGSSFIISSELKLSSSAGDSLIAYCAAESGIESALYDAVKNSVEPTAARCNPPAYDQWTVSGSLKYCLTVTGLVSDGTLTNIQAIGEYKSARRSVEISF